MSDRIKIGWRLAVIAVCALFLLASAENLASAKQYADEYLTKLRDIYNNSSDTAKKYIHSFAGTLVP